MLIGFVSTIGFGDCLLIEIVQTIDFGECPLFAIDFGCFPLAEIVRRIFISGAVY